MDRVRPGALWHHPLWNNYSGRLEQLRHDFRNHSAVDSRHRRKFNGGCGRPASVCGGWPDAWRHGLCPGQQQSLLGRHLGLRRHQRDDRNQPDHQRTQRNQRQSPFLPRPGNFSTLTVTMQMDWGARASRPQPSASRRRHQRCEMAHQNVSGFDSVASRRDADWKRPGRFALPNPTAWIRLRERLSNPAWPLLLHDLHVFA